MKALAILLLPSLAWAATAGPRRYAIGEIRVEGVVAEAERHDVEERAWKTLALLLPTDASLAPDDAVKRALAENGELRGCGDDRCNLKLGDRLGVERLLTLRLEKRDGEWTARLLDYAVDAAQVAGTLELPCPGCDVTALFDRLGRAFSATLQADVARPLCKLSITSVPVSGALVVDGVTLGRTPFTHTIAAGRHTISVEAAELARGQAEVDCPLGGAQDLTLTLGGMVKHDGDRTRRALVGSGAAGLVLFGAAAAGLGVAAFYDGRDVCDGPRCPFKYDTTVGIAVAAVAVVVFGAAGVTLLAVGLRRGRGDAHH